MDGNDVRRSSVSWITHHLKPRIQTVHVAVRAAGGDLGAASRPVPSRIGPFYWRVVSHGLPLLSKDGLCNNSVVILE